MRTVVLGLGNPVVSDDRVGLAVAEQVQRLVEQEPLAGVDVLVSTRGGFELLDLVSGYSRAIVVDAVVVPNPEPGRVRRLSLDDVAGSVRLVNAHEASIGEVFGIAGKLGIPMPGRVEILGVEAGDTDTISERMTEAVEGVVEPLAREIYAMLAAEEAEAGDSEEFARRRRLYGVGSVS